MRVRKLVVLAATIGMASGCSLPHVFPPHGGTTSGPSPYGVWYEQHWATNAVLLAAADQPEGEQSDIDPLVDFETGEAYIGADAPVEASASFDDVDGVDFDASTPYQFPSTEFVPPSQPGSASSAGGKPPGAATVQPLAPPPGGSIRY